MRRRRGKLSKSDQSNVIVGTMQAEAEPVPSLTSNVAMNGTMNGGMSDEVYYHHWAQMINIWPYL